MLGTIRRWCCVGAPLADLRVPLSVESANVLDPMSSESPTIAPAKLLEDGAAVRLEVPPTTQNKALLARRFVVLNEIDPQRLGQLAHEVKQDALSYEGGRFLDRKSGCCRVEQRLSSPSTMAAEVQDLRLVEL